MGLEDFDGRWKVGSSGRPEIPASTKDVNEYLCIYTVTIDPPWILKLQHENDPPVDLEQKDKQYQDGGEEGLHRIYCTVKFGGVDYYFEAVLSENKCGGQRVLYGSLFPTSCVSDPAGEGAAGGWSAEKQGDPPPPW